MSGTCAEHQFDAAVDGCGRCREEFCETCVVYPFGVDKLRYCLGCAVTAAGVRARRMRLGGRHRRDALERREALRQRHAS